MQRHRPFSEFHACRRAGHREPGRLRALALALIVGLTSSATGVALAAADVVTMVVGRPAPGSGALLAFDASVQPQRQATVAAQSAGTVLMLAVKAGDRVKAGQLLVRMDDRNASAGVQQGEAGMAQAQAALRLSRTQLERHRELRAQGYVSQAALDNAEQQNQAAEAGLRQAQAGASQATLARTFTTVTAPFEGVVLATHLDAGDLATPGRPVLTLYAPGALRAVGAGAGFAGGARACGTAGRGATARSALGGAARKSRTAGRRCGVADGRMAAGPGPRRQRPAGAGPGGAGAVCGCTWCAGLGVHTGRGADDSECCRAAARRELTAVYVVQGQQFVLRAVRTGPPQDGSIDVLAGLKPGERIATDAVRAGLSGARP